MTVRTTVNVRMCVEMMFLKKYKINTPDSAMTARSDSLQNVSLLILRSIYIYKEREPCTMGEKDSNLTSYYHGQLCT